MSTINDDDKFLIQRDSSSYHINATDLMSTINDDDLLLIQRGQDSYSVTALDVKDQLGNSITGEIESPVEVLTPLNGAGLNEGEAYQPLSTSLTAVNAGGDAVYETDPISSADSEFTSYSSGFEGTPTNPGNAFDGSTNTYAYALGVIADNTTPPELVVNFDPPIAYSSNVELYTHKYDSGDTFMSLNGGSYGGVPGNSGTTGWVTLTTGAGYLSQVGLKFNYTASSGEGSQMPRLFAVRVDGITLTGTSTTTLTFPTSNNFDKLEVGDVVQQRLVKIDTIEGTFYSGIFAIYLDDVLLTTDYSAQCTNTAGGSLSGSNGPGNMFDGSESTYCQDSNAAGIKINLASQSVYAKKVRVVWSNGGNGGSSLKINGVVSTPSADNYPGSASITAIDAAGPTITTDGGSWYGADGTGDTGDGRYMPSQEWSSFGSGDYPSPNSWEQTFDKDNTTSGAITLDNSSLLLDLSSLSGGGIAYTTSVVITYNRNTSAPDLIVNGTAVGATADATDRTYTINGTGLLFSVGSEQRTSGSGGDFAIKQIEVDGLLLVDSSIPGGRTTNITKTVTSDASLVFTDATELANMVGPLTQVDENGEVKVPVTSTIASVVTGSVPSPAFSTTLYSGTNDSNRQIPTGIDNTSKSLIWIKVRTANDNHVLLDSVRGKGDNGYYRLYSNQSSAQQDSARSATSFDSDGFTLGTPDLDINKSGHNYVTFNFRAAPGFMDIVTFDGNGATQSVPHSLGSVPGMIIVKGTNGGSDWSVYHRNLNGGSSPEDWYLSLNYPDAESNAVANWGGTAPTAAEFTVSGNINASLNYAAYLFADTPGKIKCDSYLGNSGSSVSVDCGFKPQWVLIKPSTKSGDWCIFDDQRPLDSSQQRSQLTANENHQESPNRGIRFTNTGFQITAVNKDAGETYIYVAIAEDVVAGGLEQTLTFEEPNPDLQYFQPGDQIGTESGFTPVLYTGNGGTQSIDCGFSPDLVWIKRRNSGAIHHLFDTVRPLGQSISSNSAAAAYQYTTLLTAFDADGFSVGNDNDVNGSSGDYIAWCWDAGDTTVTNNDGTVESEVRSNGYFSVVKFSNGYTNDATMDTFGHGLNSAPDFVLFKTTAATDSWSVYHKNLGNFSYMALDTNGAAVSYAAQTYDPTLTTMGLRGTRLSGGEKIAYCWAETPGVSSFGEYTGNSALQTIECGFEPAFVMTKSTDSSGPWSMYDNLRGTTSLLQANKGDAEETGPQVVLTSNGFTISSSSSYINESGKNYIYAAFAGNNPIEVVDVDVVNNTMTVDGGDWGVYNQSEEWSDGGVLTGSSSAPATLAFDGNLSTESNTAILGLWTVTFPEPLENVTSIRVYSNNGRDGINNESDWFLINGTTRINDILNTGEAQWNSITNPPSTFSSISWGASSTGNTAVNIYAVEVNGLILVDQSVTPTGKTQATGQPLVASANDVDFLNGNTLGVSSVSGSWVPGLFAQGAEITRAAPSHDEIIFTSMNGSTTPYTGIDSSLLTRTWTLEKSTSATGPWTEVGTYIDTAATVSQDGATPWGNHPVLEADTFYQVMVRYDASNAEYKQSTFHTFKTAPA